MGLPKISWVKLNRLRSGVGRFCLSMHKWGLAPSSNCECGATEQTADHIISQCPTRRATKKNSLQTTSDPDSLATKGGKRIDTRLRVGSICRGRGTAHHTKTILQKRILEVFVTAYHLHIALLFILNFSSP